MSGILVSARETRVNKTDTVPSPQRLEQAGIGEVISKVDGRATAVGKVRGLGVTTQAKGRERALRAPSKSLV